MTILDRPETDFAITDQTLSDDEMIEILAEKVQNYLDCDINLLMSYLYRLDVLEHKIKKALTNAGNEPGNYILARLIWERQKQRLETKKTTIVDSAIDAEWKW